MIDYNYVKRKEYFETKWFPKVKESKDIYHYEYADNVCSMFTRQHGMILYYLQTNTVVVSSDNRSIQSGLKWLIKNILNES